jgi:hypothetical protein
VPPDARTAPLPPLLQGAVVVVVVLAVDVVAVDLVVVVVVVVVAFEPGLVVVVVLLALVPEVVDPHVVEDASATVVVVSPAAPTAWPFPPAEPRARAA